MAEQPFINGDDPPDDPPDHLGDHLAAYLDGTLAPAAAATVRAHLRACARCRSAVAAAQALDSRLIAWGGVDPRFAQVPYSARQALRARVPALASRPAATPRRRLGAWATGLAALLLVLLAGGAWFAPSPGKPPGGTAAPPARWNTFVGNLGDSAEAMFRLDYPGDWNLTQTTLAPPDMILSLRFSTYKPILLGPLPTPASEDAEISLAIGQGSLQTGWPAAEMAGLRVAGYRERAYEVGSLTAVRLTDRAPHFGIYDAVYVPLGTDLTARIVLSAAAARYVTIFDTMLASVQVGALLTPTPTLAAPPRRVARSATGGTSTVCGTRDYQDEIAAAPPEPAPRVLVNDMDVCLNAAHRGADVPP